MDRVFRALIVICALPVFFLAVIADFITDIRKINKLPKKNGKNNE